MRHELKYGALAAAMVFAAGTVSAQSSARTDGSHEFAQSRSYHDYLEGQDLRASKLVGARVRNAEGDSLGEIEEVVIPSAERDDVLVIVSVGGLLDVGDKLVALPYDDLRVSLDGDTFYYDRTEAQLEAAPAFAYDAEAEAQTRAVRQTERVRPSVPAETQREPAERPRAAAPSGASVAKTDNLLLDVFDYRASDLIGAAVLDDRGESVAKVDDIVVSTEDDELHAVLAIGGFAGFGAKRIAIAFDDLQITSDGDTPRVRIAMTGEQLEQLAASRPDFRYERQVAQAPATPRG